MYESGAIRATVWPQCSRLRSYSSSDEPTGSLLTACGNRRASRCPACSRLYAADTYHLIRAGLSGGKNVPDTVRTHPRVFATLTAPSFGPVHNRLTTPGGDVRPCRCRKLHELNDALLGTPLNPATYDYEGAVLFNAHASTLWARFTTYLRRELAARLGMTQKAAHAVLRISFAKVAEYQQRGLVHFHAVIRLDGPDGNTTPPPPYATAAVLTDAARAAAARVRVTVASDTVGERELAWGEQLDVAEIAAFGTDAEFTDQAVAAYVAKYATKSADASGTLDHALLCRPCQGHGRHLLPHGTPLPCTACGGTGQTRPLSRLAVARHVRQMIRTCWELGSLPEFADLKLWKWAHMLGFRGHFSTKSRSYSTTLGALRDARRTWRSEQARAHAGLPDLDPTTTLVVGRWDYLCSGYSPGAALLAAGVWHRKELERQFAAEGGCWWPRPRSPSSTRKRHRHPRRPANTARFVYLNPEAARDFFVDYDQIVGDVAAKLRMEAGRNPHDEELIALVGELSTCSELFRQRWASQDVRLHRSGRKRVRHPVVGQLDLDVESLELPAEPGLHLNVYTAPTGTPTADNLVLLASWAATQQKLATELEAHNG